MNHERTVQIGLQKEKNSPTFLSFGAVSLTSCIYETSSRSVIKISPGKKYSTLSHTIFQYRLFQSLKGWGGFSRHFFLEISYQKIIREKGGVGGESGAFAFL